MSVNPEIVHDVWSYDDHVRRSVNTLFDDRNRDDQETINLFRDRRLGLAQILDCLVTENDDEFVAAVELLARTFTKTAPTPDRSFDGVGEQPRRSGVGQIDDPA